MNDKPNTPDLKMYCAFTLRYTNDAGEKCVLMPGQVLPVWDVRTLRRAGPDFEIVLVLLTVGANGELVPAPGAPVIPASRYRAALKLMEFAPEDAREVLAQASLYELGGASTIAVLRPHRLPVGVGVFFAPIGTTEPAMQYEEHGINYKTAFPLVETMERAEADTFPLPRLYVEGTDYAAISVSEEGSDPVGLQECMLPVCPRPTKDKQLLDLFSATTAHLERLGAKRVYIGYNLEHATSTKLGEVCDRMVTVQEVQQHKVPGPKLYTLPHGGKDYYELVKQESQQRLSLLMQGIDRCPSGVVIGDPRATHVVVQAVQDSFGTLEAAAFPV
jgi:hypothetical protein